MTGEESADKACGQVLICLKMSKLNYMVKETPFSAYVTIRKKFLQSYQIEPEEPMRVDQSDSVNKLKSDLEQVNKKNKGLLTDIALYKYNLDEFEIKINALEKVNAELELKLERVEATSECLRKYVESNLEKNADLRKEVSKLSNKNKNTKDKNENLERIRMIWFLFLKVLSAIKHRKMLNLLRKWKI